MAKFARFDARNKKKGKHKEFSRGDKEFRIKRIDNKRKIKLKPELVKNYEYIDPTEEI